MTSSTTSTRTGQEELLSTCKSSGADCRAQGETLDDVSVDK